MSDSTLDDETPEHAEGQPDPLEALRKEKEALHDRLLRTAADFDNHRKRVERELRERTAVTTVDLLRDILPILDNFERALEAPSPEDAAPFRAGVEMIHHQILELLRKRGATPIESVGTDFDPNVHEAVIHEPSESHREGEVMEELQRGYKLGDRLVRPAMVKVAKHA